MAWIGLLEPNTYNDFIAQIRHQTYYVESSFIINYKLILD